MKGQNMIQHEKKPADTLDLYQVLMAHKRPMAWTFSSVMLIVVAVTFLGPKSYTSEAKLYVRLGRESAALDPTATASSDQVLMVQESREYEINSVFELLNSRAVLSNVVAAVGPQVVLGQDPNKDSVQTATLIDSFDLFQPYSIEDQALKQLSKKLNTKAIKKSNIINLSYEAKTPELARDIVAAVIEQARDAHIRVNRTNGSHEFFSVQTEQWRDKLLGLEAELRDLKNTSGVASIVDQRTLKLQQIAELQNSLLKTEASLSASTSELAAHQNTLKRLPETITVGHTTGMPHTAIAAMREQFFNVQVREKELLSKYTKEHPLVVAVHNQVAALQAVVDKEPIEPQIALGPNTAHQEISLAYMKGESSAASLRAQAAALREQLSQSREEVKGLNNSETEIARLEREAEMVSANYKKYSEHLEQARINQELEMRNMSNLNVLQPASYSITPTKPRRILNLAIGLVAALASSLGVGLFREQRRSSILSRVLWGSQSTAHFTDAFVNGTNGHHERNGLEWSREVAAQGSNGAPEEELESASRN
jgi:uncharacterized protein involved in exopolysaccharide biosynthesis